MDRLPATVDLPPTEKDFASGLLVDLAAAMRRVRPGELVAITIRRDLGDELDRWSRFTGNAIVGMTREPAGWRYVVRSGPPAQPGALEADARRQGVALAQHEGERPIGSLLWLYTNFHCNLSCDYCCVRSSPVAPRRELPVERVRAVAREAAALGVRDLFVTGGEPFLHESIVEIVSACAQAAPTTILTNGMLFSGRRRSALEAMPRERVVLQISLDSPDPVLHDQHRGPGTWERTIRGVAVARSLGFRVRLAATVASAEEQAALHAYFDREGIEPRDRVVRRVALRGAARDGVALSRADLWPEPAITDRGVYWHPVGADDDDFFVTGDALPLWRALEAVRMAWQDERRFAETLASIFHCA